MKMMRGRDLLGLLEQLAHARGAHADEQLDELRAADREERHARLAGDRAREQRLAGAGRPDQQHAARHLAAELRKRSGSFRNWTISCRSRFAAVEPGDVVEA